MVRRSPGDQEWTIQDLASHRQHPCGLDGRLDRNSGRKPSRRTLELVQGGITRSLWWLGSISRSISRAYRKIRRPRASRRPENSSRPFILRRTKKEVLKDLPPRTEVNLYVELSPAERQLYEFVCQSAIGEIDSLAKLPQIDDQRFKLLALLTRLRQIACNPKILHETWTEGTAKMDQLIEKVELKQEGHRVLIFSQFVQHLALIRTALDQSRSRSISRWLDNTLKTTRGGGSLSKR